VIATGIAELPWSVGRIRNASRPVTAERLSQSNRSAVVTPSACYASAPVRLPSINLKPDVWRLHPACRTTLRAARMGFGSRGRAKGWSLPWDQPLKNRALIIRGDRVSALNRLSRDDLRGGTDWRSANVLSLF
jgi:hypothetical protein